MANAAISLLSGEGRTLRPALTVAAAVLCGALLAGCQTSGKSGVAGDIDSSAGSEVNIASLTAVIAQNPNDASTYNVRGSAYGRAGKFKEAIADFNTAIKINPGFYQAYANRALVERRENKDDLAFADYNQSIELDGTDPRALHNRGLIYQAQGQHTQAIDDFSKAISLAPTAAEPFNARGLSYLATNDFRAALDDFNEVVKRDKNSFEGWTNQGLALERLDERQKAFAAFARAANLNPSYKPAAEGMHRNAQGGGVALNQG
jgi:tetratricopeptide (TPR) repeat protein